MGALVRRPTLSRGSERCLLRSGLDLFPLSRPLVFVPLLDDLFSLGLANLKNARCVLIVGLLTKRTPADGHAKQTVWTSDVAVERVHAMQAMKIVEDQQITSLSTGDF